jgi:hypothetical protein
MRHGLKLTIKAMADQNTSLEQLERKKQEEDAKEYEREVGKDREKGKKE